MNPLRPIHPGEILREEFLAPLEMSANALAMALHMPAPTFDGFRSSSLLLRKWPFQSNNHGELDDPQ